MSGPTGPSGDSVSSFMFTIHSLISVVSMFEGLHTRRALVATRKFLVSFTYNEVSCFLLECVLLGVRNLLKKENIGRWKQLPVGMIKKILICFACRISGKLFVIINVSVSRTIAPARQTYYVTSILNWSIINSSLVLKSYKKLLKSNKTKEIS